MNRFFTVLLSLISLSAIAQLKSPAEFLGYEIGTEFTRHADVVRYFEDVAKNSDMVTFADYGKTNELRPLTYAIVSSKENLANLENIKKANRDNIGMNTGNSSANPETAIVWLSYNVHGNEASSTEAAMNTIYKLITEKQEYLKNTVVIIDPSVNPDGRDRYVNWYNQVKRAPYNAAQEATEHNEPWPGGRPNHYLFDLNRDWAWASQVETQQRLKLYNQWMPQIHVDFHEQGINDPYYFAPAAEPFHEVITPFQKEFQTEIGKNNAKYFDENGWLFFTREEFDLLYPSYGDTYPTFNGAIGMTYEQAGNGRAGLGIKTDEGFELTLVDRVAHHTVTGLSTIEMASKNAKRLNSEFREYFNNTDFEYKSYVLKGDPDKLKALTELLDKHEIKYGYSNGGTVSGFDFDENKTGKMESENALVVSTNQPKGTMVKVFFEPDAKLSNPLTYDITAWNIAHAYGLEAIASKKLVAAKDTEEKMSVNNIANASAAGYILNWNSMADAKFLSELLQNKIKVRFSEKETMFDGETFNRGSLIITKSDNRNNKDFSKTLMEIANKHERNLYASNTSFGDNLTDFGSSTIKIINKQNIAVLKNDAISSLSYGAVWHFFEQQLNYPVTRMDTEILGRIDLAKYDVLIMPEGSYGDILNEKSLKSITDWAKNGGNVITLGNAASAFEGKEGFGLKNNKKPEIENKTIDTLQQRLVPYADRAKESVKSMITGSIYKLKIDKTHPLAFGYEDTYFSLKQGGTSYEFLKDGYNVGYIEEPVSVSGFSGKEAKSGLKNSMVFGVAPLGRGRIIYLTDDVLFRSFWENGKLFFVNGIFFVNPPSFR